MPSRFDWREALIRDDPSSLLVGPAIHLWFPPFTALALGLAVAAVARITSARRAWPAPHRRR